MTQTNSVGTATGRNGTGQAGNGAPAAPGPAGGGWGRRAFLTALLAAPGLARAQGSVNAQDLLGRTVTLPRPARRVVCMPGRQLAVLNLLHPDPASLLAGWTGDMRTGAVAEYAAWRGRFPALDTVPVLGAATVPDPGTVEKILSLGADLVLFSRNAVQASGGADSAILRSLTEAGLPFAVVDFFASPLRDTVPSLAALGRLLGREDQAAAFTAFYSETLDRVRARTAGLAATPRVMMHAHAGGTACCNSPGQGTFNDFIRMAGGHNIGADVLPGAIGPLTLEYVLTQDPGVYVATGGSFNGRGGVLLGAGIEPGPARASLREIVEGAHLQALTAVRDGRAHAIWHGCNDNPTHMVAIEALLRWIHPDRAGGIDPRQTLEALNTRFAAVPMEGTYWVDF
jgi:iron complex transport system substrate-binding protein